MNNEVTRRRWLAVVPVVLAAGYTTAVAADADDLGKLERDVRNAVERFKRVDSGLESLIHAAAGHAVFPRVGKGGLVFGGAHGRGLVFENGVVVGTAKMSQFTFGAQIGGQSFAELILFETIESLGQFKESRYEMAAQIGAVAAAEGVSKNAKYVDGVMVFTLANRGLMAEASIGGQKFTFTPLDAK